MTPLSAAFLKGHADYKRGFLLYAPGNDINQLPYRLRCAYNLIDSQIARFEREEHAKAKAEAEARRNR